MTPPPRILPTIAILAVATFIDLAFIPSGAAAATPSEVFPIWPAEKMPGQARGKAAEPERLVTDRRRPFYQITNVSTPTVSVFLPPEETRTGGAVLVCPGGGLQRLAYEHEGLEIADWLNPLGISVFVLKYRVPAPAATALLDAQRALGLIRHRAAEFKIDPQRISAMGFSAGAEVALLLAVNSPARSYDALDDADKLSCQPTNACLVYAGGIARAGELRADIKDKLDAETTPSMFIAHAFGDASDNSLALAAQLKRANIPSEIHIYQEGGHGFGARDSGLPLNGWKASYLQWIRAQGFFDKPYLIKYADQLAAQQPGKPVFQPLSSIRPDLILADAYSAQRRLIRQKLAHDKIDGFIAAAINSASQKALSIDKPLAGVLFRSGRIDAAENLVVALADSANTSLQLQIGHIVSTGADISTHIRTVEHIKGTFEAIVPVIELPTNLTERVTAELAAADQVALNLGSPNFIVGKSKISPDDWNAASLHLKLQKNGATLQEATGSIALNQHWSNLIAVVNQIVDQGYTLHQGDVVICGDLAPPLPAQLGKYHADYGPLGTLDFELK